MSFHLLWQTILSEEIRHFCFFKYLLRFYLFLLDIKLCKWVKRCFHVINIPYIIVSFVRRDYLSSKAYLIFLVFSHGLSSWTMTVFFMNWIMQEHLRLCVYFRVYVCVRTYACLYVCRNTKYNTYTQTLSSNFQSLFPS